jgi:undecaprenyl-diphosphatase
MPRLAYPLERLNGWDRTLCVRFNRASRFYFIRSFFRIVSRVGDGSFWYGLMLALLLAFGQDAVLAVLHMILVGGACAILYKWLKRKTLRPRPFQVNPDVICMAAPLDQFSFPSGHTVHAVAFSTVALAYFPWLWPLLLPFALLVAVSRMVLGLHYPSDVLAGALVGLSIAAVSLVLL